MIYGRVVDGTTDVPVAGATVTFRGTAPVPDVLTDTEGRFVFFDLDAGSYVLGAERTGYVSGSHGQTTLGGRSQPLRLGDGEHRTGVTLRLWKLGSVSGRVVDERGEPVVGVQVRAYGVVLAAGRPFFGTTAARVTRTDDRGLFRIAGLNPGTDFVISVPTMAFSLPTSPVSSAPDAPADPSRVLEFMRFNIPAPTPGAPHVVTTDGVMLTWLGPPPPPSADGRPRGYPSLFHPNALDVGAATPVRVRAGDQIEGVDFRLVPSALSRLTGTLTGPDGPLASATLALSPIRSSDAIANDLETAVAISNGAGDYAFPAVPPGRYVVSVLEIPSRNAGSWALASSTTPNGLGQQIVTTDPWAEAQSLWARSEVVVGDEPVRLDLQAEFGLRVSGRIVFRQSAPDSSTSGRVSVSIEPANGQPIGRVGFTEASVNELGEFRSVGLPAGRYFVRARPPRGWAFESAMHEGRDLGRTPLDLAGADLTDVVITLTDALTELSGMVRTVAGVPDADALVAIYPADRALWSDFGRRVPYFSPALPEADGSFSTSNLRLPPGDYLVVAVADTGLGDWLTTTFFERAARVATRVTLEAGRPATVQLTTATIQR